MRIHRQAERGSVFLGVMMMIVPICALVGLVTDVGWWYFTAQSAHAAAQAAAVAAVRSAMDEVTAGGSYTCGSLTCQTTPANCPTTIPNLMNGCVYATSNGFTSAGLGGRQSVKIQSNTTSPVLGVGTSYWVTVEISQQNPLTFLAVLGGSTVNVGVRATAAMVDTIPDACVTALDPTASGAVTAQGNPTVTLLNCSMKIASNSTTALSVGGSACVTAGAIQIVGGDSASCTTPTPITNVAAFSDPLAGLAAPTVPTGCTHPAPSGSTYYPGNYCSGLSGTMTFSPGVYNMMGAGVDCHGNCALSGTGVTFYMTCSTSPCNGAAPGSITMNGNGVVNLSAPTSGPLAGILMFEDRTAAAGTAKINGNNSPTLNGTLYFPKSTISFSGDSSGGVTQLIADMVSFKGNTTATFQSPGNGIPSQPTAALIE